LLPILGRSKKYKKEGNNTVAWNTGSRCLTSAATVLFPYFYTLGFGLMMAMKQ